MIVPKVRVPAELFCKANAVGGSRETVVLPKSMLAVEPVTRMHCVTGSVMLVPPVG